MPVSTRRSLLLLEILLVAIYVTSSSTVEAATRTVKRRGNRNARGLRVRGISNGVPASTPRRARYLKMEKRPDSDKEASETEQKGKGNDDEEQAEALVQEQEQIEEQEQAQTQAPTQAPTTTTTAQTQAQATLQPETSIDDAGQQGADPAGADPIALADPAELSTDEGEETVTELEEEQTVTDMNDMEYIEDLEELEAVDSFDQETTATMNQQKSSKSKINKKRPDPKSVQKSALKLSKGSQAQDSYDESFGGDFISEDLPLFTPIGPTRPPVVEVPGETDAPIAVDPTNVDQPTSSPTTFSNAYWEILEGATSEPIILGQATSSPVQTPVPEEVAEAPTSNPYWEVPEGQPSTVPVAAEGATDNPYWEVSGEVSDGTASNSLVVWECPPTIVQLQSVIEVDFVGSPEALTDSEISSLERTVETLYNTESLLLCDTYVRTIIGIDLQLGGNGYVYNISATCRDCPPETTLLTIPSASVTATGRNSGGILTDASYLQSGDYFNKVHEFYGASVPHAYYEFVEEVDNLAAQKGRVRGGGMKKPKARLRQNDRALQAPGSCFCPADVPPTSPQAPTAEEFAQIQNEAIEQLRNAGVLTSIESIGRLEELQ